MNPSPLGTVLPKLFADRPSGKRDQRPLYIPFIFKPMTVLCPT